MAERENFFAQGWDHLERPNVENLLRDALTRADERALQLEEAEAQRNRIYTDLRKAVEAEAHRRQCRFPLIEAALEEHGPDGA